MSDEGNKPPAGRGDSEAPALLGIWRELKELAERARAEGWTPERTREAIARLTAESQATDETDKPAA
jgi:hypothetical protein